MVVDADKMENQEAKKVKEMLTYLNLSLIKEFKVYSIYHGHLFNNITKFKNAEDLR